jgi:HAMP domain-containing protein
MVLWVVLARLVKGLEDQVRLLE